MEDMALYLSFIGNRSCTILTTSPACTSLAPTGGAKRIFVCSWCRCFVLFSSLTFSAASSLSKPTHATSAVQLINTLSPSPSSQPAQEDFINTTDTDTHTLVTVILSVSAFILLIMGFFTFLRINLNKRRRRSQRVGDAEMPPTPSASDFTGGQVEKKTISIRKFSWEEIVSLSRKLSTVIGQGGYSTVYLAEFADSTRGALKIYPASQRLNQIFKLELNILLHLRHENIIQLLGYCDNNEQQDDMGGVLVFEYVPSGNLQEELHGNGGVHLPWKRRMWIAFQLARAIQYLHDQCTFPIVHGDIKASNILLDDQLNCKLCDFGSAQMGCFAPPSSRSLIGSPGYTDPHYIKTGMASTKNDVYSFGVIILELITGMEAFCPEKKQLLTAKVGPLLVGDEVDPLPFMEMEWTKHDFDNSDSQQEVKTMASLAGQCLRQQPSLRPCMADIIITMTQKVPSISSLFDAQKKATAS